MRNIKVSVIVPVYNVAQWVERCVRSLMEQSLEEIEYIFVDDCSPDNSMDIIRRVVGDYPKRDSNVRYLYQEHNRGLLQARLRGELEATGEYIANIDSDDWVEPDTYATLYEQAKREDADCVIMGYQRDFKDHTEACHRIYTESDGQELMRHLYRYGFELSSCELLMRNDDRLRTLLQQYQRPEWEHATMWEDVAVMMPYYYGVRRISYCDRCLYHYNRMNVSSALNTVSLGKAQQAINVMRYLTKYFQDDPQMRLSLGVMTLGAKNMMLGKVPLEEWRETEAWCNKYVMKYTSIPLKVRIFYWLLIHNQDWAYNMYAKRP